MSLLPITSSLLPSCHSLPSPLLLPRSICKDHSHRSGSCISSLSFSHRYNVVHRSFCKRKRYPSATTPSEGVVSVANSEDIAEKDWSFLDSDELSTEQNKHQMDRIISMGEIEESSRVLVSIGSEGFVDRLVESSPCQMLLVVHDSVFSLALIKENYDDEVICWQGELISVPKKWAPLDVVFLYFLPAMSCSLDQIFKSLAKRCSSGARVVISHPQGREALVQQREQFPDVIISDLPDKLTLREISKVHSFEITEFIDEPDLYLAVLKFC